MPAQIHCPQEGARADKYENWADPIDAPCRSAAAVAPHATDPLPDITKALYVGGAGNVVGRLVDDQEDVTFANVPAGALLPFRFSHVRTDTTATAIVALY